MVQGDGAATVLGPFELLQKYAPIVALLFQNAPDESSIARLATQMSAGIQDAARRRYDELARIEPPTVPVVEG